MRIEPAKNAASQEPVKALDCNGAAFYGVYITTECFLNSANKEMECA